MGVFFHTLLKGRRHHPEARDILISIARARKERVEAIEDMKRSIDFMCQAKAHMDRVVKILEGEE